jgi:hypothetical protein
MILIITKFFSEVVLKTVENRFPTVTSVALQAGVTEGRETALHKALKAVSRTLLQLLCKRE